MQRPTRTPSSRLLMPADAAPKTTASSALRAKANAIKREPTKSSTLTVTMKKTDELFRRMQQHTIVQSYDKLMQLLRVTPSLCVNGECLTLQPTSSRAFHYGQSFLALSPSSSSSATLHTIKTIEVTLMACNHTIPVFHGTLKDKNAWRLVAESDARMGFQLFAMDLGKWQSSSLVVLVWRQNLEILQWFLQLNVAETLYCVPVDRPLRILPDDVDLSYGLHSFTCAVTLRTLDHILWEKEWYHVEFTMDQKKSAMAVLLTMEDVYKDPSRVLSASIGLPIQTEAIAYTIPTALVLDVNLWEPSGLSPVYCRSRLVTITNATDASISGDFTLSAAGQERTHGRIQYEDVTTRNSMEILLESVHKSPKTTKTFLKQVTLTLSLAFINQTFQTQYK